MSSLTQSIKSTRMPRPDGAWLVIIAILGALGLFDPNQLLPSIEQTLASLLSTAPYIAIAIFLIGYLNATGAESVIAKAFEGRETTMIFMAALIGGVTPFCSCEVVPFVAALLAAGAPLSAIMAFWLSSPLIDPPSLLITAGALGWDFAIAKMLFAVGIGLYGGFAIKAIVAGGGLSNPRKEIQVSGCGCGPSALSQQPVWKFWQDTTRIQKFKSAVIENAFFLLKWLTLAYLLESLLKAYIPAKMISSVAGGEGIAPIFISALVGVPAYLNSYAAPPLVAGLMDQGMSSGAGMAFMIGGAVSCIPAMTAVFALVRPPVFIMYSFLGLSGAILSGIIFSVFI